MEVTDSCCVMFAHTNKKGWGGWGQKAFGSNCTRVWRDVLALTSPYPDLGVTEVHWVDQGHIV